jgi:transcriptional regulator with GAF, ATPase, and Fis domain
LAVFSRSPINDQMFDWLRAFADNAAVAIANARAFEEIEALKSQLELENEYLRHEIRTGHGFGGIVGSSSGLQKVLQQVDLVASTDSGVLVLGESGVGKELIARAIHDHSSRGEHPLVKVNCASIPRELFESEFFGHVQGAFTGATRDRVGRFELADRGTLFLDEVGEIPLDMQGKLLRVLQEGTYERVGDEKTRSTDVRVVAATNRDLQSEVRAKRFRQDLYYRLSVFPIEVIALRDLKEDIPLLVSNFLGICSRKFGIDPPRLKQRHIIQLQQYSWPGNIRELQNVVERAVISSRSGALEFHLPTSGARGSDESFGRVPEVQGKLLSDAEMKRFERQNLIAVLEKTKWKISGAAGAAEFLGVHPATLTSRLRVLGIKRPRCSLVSGTNAGQDNDDVDDLLKNESYAFG